MDKLLDWIHANKRWIGIGLGAVAWAADAAGYHDVAKGLLTFGTVAGVGYLPNGPNPLSTIPPK